MGRYYEIRTEGRQEFVLLKQEYSSKKNVNFAVARVEASTETVPCKLWSPYSELPFICQRPCIYCLVIIQLINVTSQP